MSEDFSWIPGTVVLAAGLLVGLWAAFRLRRVVPSSAGSDLSRLEQDLHLEIVDLTARRDDLYARLRGEGEEEELEADEVRVLEKSAARTLRDLDRAQAALSKIRPEKSQPKSQASSKAAATAPASTTPATPAKMVPATAGTPVQHHPFLWFLLGAGLMGLVGFLVFWADRDAKPDPMAAQNMPAGNSPPAASGMPADHPTGGGQGLAPDVQAQVTALQADVEANPRNLEARKQLAVLLAQNQQYFEAFKHSEEILRESPDDIDALYISGVVRLAMGQAEDAVSLLDRVIAQFPGHVLAHLGRGAAMLKLERRDEALASWQTGLRSAGGSNPAIEGMIAEEFGAAVLTGGAPVAPPVASGAPTPRPAPASPSPGETGEPKVFRVFIELATGVQAPAGGSLFVSVHNAGGGPPAAVRRIGDPQFPLEVTLTQDNSMTGIALPARGMVRISLDSDGHPGTQSESDLSAQGEAASGELAKFVLW